MRLDNLPKGQTDTVSFALDWNDNLSHLNPELFSTTKKVRRFLHKTAFYPLSFLKNPVSKALSGSSVSSGELKCVQAGFDKVWFDDDTKPCDLAQKNYWKTQFITKSSLTKLRKTFKPVDFTVQTPDDVKLRGTVFHKSDNPNAKTLLICSGRMQLYQQGAFAWLLKLIKDNKLDINLVMYNPRGFGHSEGEASLDGFQIDAETIYQYIHQQLGVEEDNIDIYGFSLGGAAAVKLKAMHANTSGKLIHERSFVDSHKQLYYLLIKQFGDNIFTKLVAAILDWLIGIFGWHGSILEDWKSIDSEKLIIAHKQDPVIPYDASLLKAVENDEEPTTEAILLDTKPGRQYVVDHHFEDLSHYMDEKTNNNALSLVTNFLKK